MIIDKDNIELKKIKESCSLKDKEVLEIGCGDGRVTSLLSKKTKKLVAIDPDKKNIKKAKLKVDNVDFIVGSGDNLNFPNQSFDLIIFTYSLHHQNSPKALKEAHRVLKDNGRLLIIEPELDGEVEKFVSIFDKKEEQALAMARIAIKENDFKIIKQELFYTDWVFRDREELIDHFLTCRNSIENKNGKKRIILEINKLLGNKVNYRPLIIQDKASIFSMKK